MNRRCFLSSILALGVAPAIVRADSLMRIVPRETTIVVPMTTGKAAYWVGEGAPGIQMVDMLGRNFALGRRAVMPSALVVSKLIVPVGCTLDTAGHTLLVSQTIDCAGTIIDDSGAKLQPLNGFASTVDGWVTE